MSSVLSSDIQTMVTNFLRNTSTTDHNMVAGLIIYSRAGFLKKKSKKKAVFSSCRS